MKRLPIVLSLALISICAPSIAAETADTPERVLQLLNRASGSWYVKIGKVDGACTVNSRANGRCVIVEGRKFGDAISYTSLFGWYAPKQQIIGLIVFENGESLLVRAKVGVGTDKLTAEGDVVGVLSGRAVKATYKATDGTEGWSVELRTDSGKTIQGHFRSTGRNR